MGEIAIRTTNLSKTYRLYSQPHYRLLDLLGILGSRKNAYTEHDALTRINLTIEKGEKVAIIGRNGAGKSTLLKLISNVIEPSAGTIEVNGEARALLQIGTGFHPDFTGRENVFAYLAHFGITGDAARAKFEEIVDFAELEEYIDQPLKVYSTGMGVRLMFAASTAITPNILVLDEVLSVGDAYFSHKSFERIRDLCEGSGTTLLLVSHDVYSASKICPRMIWLDRGAIVMDGDSPAVLRAYEDSIREQEETRLRKRKQKRLESISADPSSGATHLLLEFKGRNNQPQRSPIYFSRIQLFASGALLSTLPVGANAFDSQTESHLEKAGSNWGEATLWQGREARPMVNFGGVFHKVSGVFRFPVTETADNESLELVVEYWTDEECDVLVRAIYRNSAFDLGTLSSKPGQWVEHRTVWSLRETKPVDHAEAFLEDISLTGIQGSGRIGTLDVSVLDEHGKETHIVTHGAPVTFRVRYLIRDAHLHENAQVLIVLHRDGIQDVCRFFCRDLGFDGSRPRGTILLHVPSLGIGNGTYTVTVMIAKEGYYDRPQFLFYALNPDVYECAGRILEITVVDGGAIGSGTGVVAKGKWSIVEDLDFADANPTLQSSTGNS